MSIPIKLRTFNLAMHHAQTIVVQLNLYDAIFGAHEQLAFGALLCIM
jgi:hypothetical protein